MRQTKKAYEGLYNKYIKRGLDIIITGNASWSAVGFAIISVCVAIVILTPVKCLVLKYIPWCLGKKKG